jgi:transglutaminase-like putative cysteine protease
MSHDRERLVNDAVLYAAALVVSGSGVWAVTLTLDDPGITRAFVLTLIAGFAVSWFARRYQNLWPYALLLTVGLMAGGALWYRATGTMLGQPLLEVVGADRQLELAAMLAGLVIARSFGLLRIEDLLFCVVPSLAIFGVLGSKTFDPAFIAAFVVYAFASAYLAGHSHLVIERQQARMPPSEDARRVARQRFVLLAALFVIASVIAVPFSRAAATLLPAYQLPERMSASRADRTAPTATAGRAVWENTGELPVGTGPIRLSRRVVMRVFCDQPLYWRANSVTYYTGESWQDDNLTAAARLTPDAAGVCDLRATVNAPPGPTVRQRFEPVNPQGTILFGAMQPVHVVVPPAAGVGDVVVRALGSMYATARGVPQNQAYEVISQVDNLRAAAAPSVLSADDPRLVARPPLSARAVEGFAREAVGSITNPAAKIDAIVSWVQARARYSLNAPATPAGEDAVVYFLTSSRVGYCDLFASAVALMCRAQGIPARIAIGYAPGERDAASGAYIVRDEDAHAWVEAYVRNKGWITVEASPATAEQARVAASRAWTTRLSRFISRHMIAMVVLLAALGWGALLVKNRWLDEYLARRRRERTLGAQGHRGAIILLYDTLTRALAKRGLPRRPSETPNEYARRLGKSAYLVLIMPGVSVLTAEYLAARFGARDIAAQQADTARQALVDIRQRLRRIRTVQ